MGVYNKMKKEVMYNHKNVLFIQESLVHIVHDIRRTNFSEISHSHLHNYISNCGGGDGGDSRGELLTTSSAMGSPGSLNR